MATASRNSRSKRNMNGTALYEFGPALFLALIMLFFPAINFLGLVLSYADCLYLTDVVLRRAAVERDLLVLNNSSTPSTLVVNSSPATLATDIASVVSEWKNGFGKFAVGNFTPTVTTNVEATSAAQAQYQGQSGSTPVAWYVDAKVVCECRPFLTIPFFVSIPGLSAPITFQFNGRAVIENIPRQVT